MYLDTLMAFVMVDGSSILTYIGKKSTNETCPMLTTNTPDQFQICLELITWDQNEVIAPIIFSCEKHRSYDVITKTDIRTEYGDL